MLQFIVLGIVPGTSIQLSFADVILSGLLFAGVPVLYWNMLSYTTRRRAKKIAAIQLIAL